GAAVELPIQADRTYLNILKTLRLGAKQSRFLNQNALSLVSLSGEAAFEHNSGQSRVLACAPSKRCVARLQEDEVIEVGAGQAEGATFPNKRDPCAASQFLSTFVA